MISVEGRRIPAFLTASFGWQLPKTDEVLKLTDVGEETLRSLLKLR
jgi:hypothetical protein